MASLKKTASVSIKDYLDGENLSEVKHEYLGGWVFAVMKATRDHAAISANAIGTLVAQLRGRPCRTSPAI